MIWKSMIKIIMKFHNCFSRENKGNWGTIGFDSCFTNRDGCISMYCSEQGASFNKQKNNIKC